MQDCAGVTSIVRRQIMVDVEAARDEGIDTRLESLEIAFLIGHTFKFNGSLGWRLEAAGIGLRYGVGKSITRPA